MTSSSVIKELQMEITNYCQARCPECAREKSQVKLKKPISPYFYELNNKYITFDEFKSWFNKDDWKMLELIDFCGNYDEPTTNPDLLKIIDWILSDELFSKEVVEKSIVKTLNTTETIIAINEGNGVFKMKSLPNRVQFSCVCGIICGDVNNDGHLDIIAGNKGENSFFKGESRMYVSDFDNNGTTEQIICFKKDNKYYPIVDRDELISQIASLKQKLLFYKDYANANMETIFSKEQLDKAIKLDVKKVNTSLFINKNNTFISLKLPNEIQYSNVEAIEVFDVNDDGYLDLFFGGNQYLVKPQFGRQDASQGWLVYGDKNYEFKKVIPLNIKGQIRDFNIFKINNKNYFLTTINNNSLQFYEINEHK